MRLREIVTSPVATVAPDSSLADAARKMLNFDVGLLPVSKGQEVVGIVSLGDIAQHVRREKAGSVLKKVSQPA